MLELAPSDLDIHYQRPIKALDPNGAPYILCDAPSLADEPSHLCTFILEQKDTCWRCPITAGETPPQSHRDSSVRLR